MEYENRGKTPRLSGQLQALTIIGIVLLVALATIGTVRRAGAYGDVGASWTSVGCWFSGNIHSSYSNSESWSTTYRDPYSSCGTYAMISWDYKYTAGGSWNYGPYVYCYTGPTYACQVYAGWAFTNIYSYHQIYTSGAWRQIEHLTLN